MSRAAARAAEAPALLGALREQCARVAGEAEHVRINEGAVAEYTRFILGKYPIITGHDEHHLVSADPEETASYVLALDSVNFGSGYFRAAGLEYADIAGGLKNAFLRGEMNAAEKWAAATPEECRKIFGARARSAALDELMSLFSRHLNVTGRLMRERYDGRTMNLLREAGRSVARLVDIMAEWETFSDVARYRGRDIPFLKRAQIFGAHLELTGVPEFADMDALTCFADNMVPHVLRCDNILAYAPALAARIDGGQELAAGSPEETEIRACSIHAVELMKAAAARDGRAVTSPNIDHLLWNRGYEPDIYRRPSHRTRTVWY